MQLTTLSNSLSPTEIADRYDRDGFLVIENVFSASECDDLKAESRRLLQRNGSTGKSIVLQASTLSPVCRQLAEDERLLAILRPLLPDGIVFSHNRVAFKSGKVSFATPWHTDAFYWANSRHKISLWIALDDAAAEDGALQVVRGSHGEDWSARHVEGPAANVDEFPKYIAARQWPPEDEIACAVRRGGLVVFGDRTIHGTRPNTSGRERYTIISVYQGPGPDDYFDVQCPGRRVCWLP
jgi:ectoine hydroxylase-related dioxygenase (phytanoyl-CoA dioxygenase family)